MFELRHYLTLIVAWTSMIKTNKQTNRLTYKKKPLAISAKLPRDLKGLQTIKRKQWKVQISLSHLVPSSDYKQNENICVHL